MPNPSEDLEQALRGKSRGRRERLGASSVTIEPHTPRNDLLPGLTLLERDPHAVVLPKRNVRRLDPAHVRDVANAISALGFCDPVLIDGDDCVLDGVVRVEAARQLGLAKVPCIMADHLSASEKRLLRLAMNRLGEKGRWQIDELRLEFQELILDEAPIEISGFTLPELDQILIDEEADVVEAGPLGPEPDQVAVVRLGDVLLLGSHRVVCGDARHREVLDIAMAGSATRLILTDQPYNVRIVGNVTNGGHREFAMASGEMNADQFRAFNEAWIAAAAGHLVDGGLLATFIDWRGLSSVTAAAVAGGLDQLNLIVWAKTNAGMGSLYRSQHELLPIFKKGRGPHLNNVDLGRTGRWRSNLWTYPGASSLGSDARRGLQSHPTVKPVAMLEDALLDVTKRGDVVLDPFLGSGSTLIAAEMTGRVCRGVELDPLYVDVVARRYEQVTGRPTILEATGEAFGVLTERRAREPDRDDIAPDKASARG